MADTLTAQFPEDPVDKAGTDLAAPAVAFLTETKLIGAIQKDGTEQVIESAELGLTKTTQRFIGAVGGATVILGALSTGFEQIRQDRVSLTVLIGGLAVVAAAIVLGLAMVMNGDVRGRATVTTQQIEERGRVAGIYLTTAAAMAGAEPSSADATVSLSAKERDLRVALAVFGERLEITAGKSSGKVAGLRWESEELRIKLASGDWVALADVTDFTTG